MTTRLYVDNLTRGMNDSDLEALFAPHGTVQSAHIVTDEDTGNSKGSGYVEMATGGQAQAAIAALNGTESNGRTLAVSETQPQEELGVILVSAQTGTSGLPTNSGTK